MLDCTDVNKLVEKEPRKSQDFVFLSVLTQWALDCLKQIEDESRKKFPKEQEQIEDESRKKFPKEQEQIEDESRKKFPKEQEQILFDKIKSQVKVVKSDLIQIAIQDLKFIGVILRDYKVGDNVNFNKLLVESLFSSYKSISNQMDRSMKKTFKQKFYDFLQPDPQKELDRYLDSSKKAKIDSYLYVRRDVDSLRKIYYTINSVSAEKIFEINHGEESIERSPSTHDKRLAFQRVCHIMGEYVKDTPSTPNLLPSVRKSLDQKGVPTKALSKNRDMLAHYQVYPLITENDNQIKELFEKYFLPIQEAIKRTIIETEDSFLQKIIEEKGKEFKIDKSVVEELKKSKRSKGVKGLEEYIKMQSKDSSMDDENKIFFDELYQTIQRMESRHFPIDSANSPRGEPSEKKSKIEIPTDSIIEYINQSNLDVYNKLYNDIAPNLEIYAGELKKAHDDVVKIQTVIDSLSYKGTFSSTKSSIFDNFSDQPILKKIIVKNDRSLKQELDRYFDAKSFKNNDAYVASNDSNPTNLIDLLNTNINEPNDNKKKLIEFFYESNKSNIKPEEYEQLVHGLGIKYDLKEKLFLYSVEWRKKKCVDLLKKNPLALKTMYDRILENKSIDSSVYDRFTEQYKLPPERPTDVEERVKRIHESVQQLYSRRVREEVEVLNKVKNPYATESQLLNLYSLLDRASDKKKKNENKGNEENDFIFKSLRNYLGHGDALLTIEDDKIIAIQLVKVKNAKKVIKMLKDPNLTLYQIEGTIDSFKSYVGVKNIVGLLCSPGHSNKSTRSASKSCLTWEEIDKFNKGGAKNRDPDNIIIHSEKFVPIISSEFEANVEKFSKFIDLASESEVIGDHKNKVNKLTDNHRHLSHLEKIGKVSSKAMQGMMVNSLMMDLVHGNAESFMEQVYNIYLSAALTKVADVVSMKGQGSILKGKVWRGKFLKMTSPIISNVLSAFTVNELIQHVKEFNEGDEDALVPIIGNSIELLTDAVLTGAEIVQALGYLKGATRFTGPIGMAIGVVTSVGLDTYRAITAVTKTDIDLTGWEIIFESSRILLGFGLSANTEQVLTDKELNNEAVKNAIQFLKDNPHIQRYVFPSMNVQNMDTCTWIKGSLICQIKELLTSKPPHNPEILNNTVLLREKQYNIKWSRARPNDRQGSSLFCLPAGDHESVPFKTYHCEGAIGVEYTNDRTGNYTLINLGAGVDKVFGFPHSSNIFVFGEGHKYLLGGDKDDKFIFGATSANSSSDIEINGDIDGYTGRINTVDIGKLKPHFEQFSNLGSVIYVDFYKGSLTNGFKVDLMLTHINAFLGREGAIDRVVAACSTKRVDGRGGKGTYYSDDLVIPNNHGCFYDIEVTVNPYTIVNNYASRGNFLYFVKGKKGTDARIELDRNSQTNNTFVFNYTLKDVASIDKSKNYIIFSFVEEFYKVEKKIDVNSSFNLTVSGANKNITTYYLIDNTKIEIGQNNVYAVQNTEKAIDSLVNDYSSIADKSQMQVIVQSNGEVLRVGNNHWDVFMNDPNSRTSHLVGGGGENIFIITSGHEKLTLAKLPISDVVIYDFDQEEKTDTLDLCGIKEQVKEDIDREINTDVSKIDSDLLINLSLDDASKKEVVKIRLKGALENNWYKRVHIVIDSTFIIEEILEDFELTPRPLIFDDNSKNLYTINLTDVGKGHKVRVKKEIGDYIFARDNDDLVITNWLSSSADKNNVFSVVLEDFYNRNNQDKMQWLKIEFDDKKILLKKEIERINSARNFNELKSTITIDSYKSVMYGIKKQTLFEAIEGNNIGEVKKLIDHGVSIDARNNDGQTPLQSAAKSGNLEVVKYLIEEKHADVNVQDYFANNPLQYAACDGNPAVVKYLLEEKHADVNSRIKPLHYAAYCGNLEVVKYLIEEKHTDVNVYDYYRIIPLHYAAFGNSLNVVKYLINKEGVNVNVICKALHYATAGGNLELVKYLIEEKGVNVNAGYNHFSPLHIAVSNGDLKMTKYLIGKGANIKQKDPNGRSLIHLAVIDHIDKIRKKAINPMAGRGTYFNLRNNFGWTASYSAVNGQLEVLKYLRQKKITDLYVKDNFRKTPLHYAAAIGDDNQMILTFDCGSLSNRNIKDLTTDDERLEVVKVLLGERQYTDAIYTRDMFQNSHLHYAAVYGKLEVVKYFVEKGANVNIYSFTKCTPLQYAAAYNRPEVVKYLIGKGAFTHDQNGSGNTFVDLAVINTCLDVLKYIVEEMGTYVNIHTLLHHVAHTNNLEIVKFLIEIGAKIDFKINGNTPLNILESRGHKQLVNSIVNKLTERLFDAVKYDEFSEVQHLINQGVGINVKHSRRQPLLHFAASNGKLKVIKYLIEKKQVDFNAKDVFGRTCLHSAARNGTLEVVKYLIEKKQVDFNVKDNGKSTPLLDAAGGGNLEVAKYLVEEKGANINVMNNYGIMPLHNAAESGSLEMVKYIIEEKNGNVNVRTNDGQVPLHFAARTGKLGVVKYLVEEKEVNVNVRANDGQVPLHFAARTGKLGVVKYLVVEKEVNVNITDNDGATPLHIVAMNGNLEIARYLIEEKNADVSVKTNSGDTPLHSAAIKGRLEMVKYLTEKKGVDINVKNNNGYTPLDLAAARCYSNIVANLEMKLNEKIEKPRQHKRSHQHSLHKLLTTDSSNQPEMATNNASEKSSGINDLVGSTVKLQESSAPSEPASSNHPIRHKRPKRHNDHSRHADGMRTHRVRRRQRRVQKRNDKYQDAHYYINQPEIAASSGTRPSSWINGLLDWIKEKGDGLVSSVADKFAAKESEDSKSRGNHACSVTLEKMYTASIPNIPQSRTSQGVPKLNIPNTSWFGRSFSREKVTSNVTDAPEMNTTVVNNALILCDLAVRLVNGTRHKQPIHENLLSLREKSMRFIDENMIMRTIQQGKEKFGGLDVN